MQFLIDFLFLLVVVYGFGTLLSTVFCSSLVKSISFAPLFSFGGLFLISAVRCAVGLTSSWRGIVLPFCAISAIAFCINWVIKSKCHDSNPPELCCTPADFRLLGLYVTVGALVASFVFIKTLDTAASFFQGYDNYYHINTVRQYLTTGYYCSFPVTQYPNLWHCLTAITASFGSSAIPTAINAFNFLLVGFVIPTSVYLLMETVFHEDKRIVFAGAFTTFLCNTFPWNYVCNGPLYALLIGWALLPISMALFASFCSSKTLRSLTHLFVAFCASCLVLVVAHPSVIFAGIAILTPLGCYSAFSAMRSHGFSRVSSCAVAIIFFFAVYSLWNYCFKSPLFAGVVNFSWTAPLTISIAFSNAFVGSLSSAHSPQFLLMFLVMLGFLFVIRKPRYRWLAFSLCIAAFICIVSEGVDGYWRHFFCGFWYNDWNRLTGLYGFMLAFLAAPGLASFLQASSTLYEYYSNDETSCNLSHFYLCVCSFLLIIVMLPSFSIQDGIYVTPFGYVRNRLFEYNDLSENAYCYDSDEIAFTDKVKKIVGDSRVLNYPYDGSCFAYAISDLNIVNRSWWVDDLDESHPTALMRMKIDQVATDENVRRACAQEDVSYILILDYGHMFGDGVFNYTHRVPQAWTGITSVTDSTPGMELMLSEGDMRLYKIIES